MKLTETKGLLDERVAEVQDAMRQLEDRGAEHRALEETLRTVKEEVEKLQEKNKETEQKLVDQSIEHKISGKRQVQMIKDFKKYAEARSSASRASRREAKEHDERVRQITRRNG